MVVGLKVSECHLRSGGTVAGSFIVALSDVAIYVTTLARIGREAMALTSNCSIDFTRKPAAGIDLLV